jgi:hypothetical protein
VKEKAKEEASVKAGGKQSSTCLAYSSTLKMVATCYSEKHVDFKRTTRRYIPEDRTLHNQRRESPKFYNLRVIKKIQGRS